MEHPTHLVTRQSCKDRLLQLIDAFAALGPGSHIDAFDATDELTGENGMAFQAGSTFEAFTLAEAALIADLLSEIARERPALASAEGVICLKKAFQEMLRRATAASQ